MATAYVAPNFKTKKALANAIARGRWIIVYHPTLKGCPPIPKNGHVKLEGPHLPEPRRWEAVGEMKAGKLVGLIR
jgi:hypothetical protein